MHPSKASAGDGANIPLLGWLLEMRRENGLHREKQIS